MVDLKVLFRLIREYATRDDLVAVLRAHRLPFSAGTWEEMWETRVAPAIATGNVAVLEIIDLLREMEECGRQHVFLWEPRKKSVTYPTENAIQAWLRGRRWVKLSEEPVLVDQPSEVSEVVDVRRFSIADNSGIQIKEVQRRFARASSTEEQETELQIVRTITLSPVRAVNVVRLHRDGLLEVRVSRSGIDIDYKVEEDRLLALLNGLVDLSDYQPKPLQKARRKIFGNRHRLDGTVRFLDSQLRASGDFVMRLAAGDPQADLFDSDATSSATDVFTQKGSATCEELYLTFRKQRNTLPRKDVRVLLAGRPHQLTVTGKCSASDYEHVLGFIRKANS